MLPDLHSKAVPAKYKRLPFDTEVLPIKESELAPTHPPAEGGTLDGDVHKGGTTPAKGGMLDGDVQEGGTMPAEGGMFDGDMHKGGTTDAHGRSTEACGNETSQPCGKAGKKHKKKKKALSKDEGAGNRSAGGGTQRVL